MKQLCLFACLLFVLTACQDDDDRLPDACTDGFRQGDVITLIDATRVQVLAIEDQLCPCDVVCITGGTVNVILQVEGGNRGPDTLNNFGSMVPNTTANYGWQSIRFDTMYNHAFCGGDVPNEEICVGLVIE